MTRHDCTGDVDTCRICAGRRDALEYGDGWTERDLDHLADAAAAHEWASRGGAA